MPVSLTMLRKRAVSVLLAAVLLSACQRQIPFKSTQKVSDPSSPLLGVLMNRSEVPGNWVWYREGIYQGQEDSTYSGHVLAEAAARTVTGDYGVEPYYTQVTHRLERYESSSPSLEDLKQRLEETVKGEENSNTHTFSPELALTGTGMESKCVSADLSKFPDGGVKECWVVVRYSHIVSWLIFNAVPGSIDDGSITEILNQILTTVDGRIKEIDK